MLHFMVGIDSPFVVHFHDLCHHPFNELHKELREEDGRNTLLHHRIERDDGRVERVLEHESSGSGRVGRVSRHESSVSTSIELLRVMNASQ